MATTEACLGTHAREAVSKDFLQTSRARTCHAPLALVDALLRLRLGTTRRQAAAARGAAATRRAWLVSLSRGWERIRRESALGLAQLLQFAAARRLRAVALVRWRRSAARAHRDALMSVLQRHWALLRSRRALLRWSLAHSAGAHTVSAATYGHRALGEVD